MRHAIDSGIVTGDAPVSFWLSVVTVPEVFAKVNSAQFPSVNWRPCSGDLPTAYPAKQIDFGHIIGRISRVSHQQSY